VIASPSLNDQYKSAEMLRRKAFDLLMVAIDLENIHDDDLQQQLGVNIIIKKAIYLPFLIYL
jgi:hypothetical protein